MAKQNGSSLSEYYRELMEIFMELDHSDKVVMKDTDNIASYKKSVERLKVHIFVAGLDREFEQIRGANLGKETLPDLEECYSQIRQKAILLTKAKRLIV